MSVLNSSHVILLDGDRILLTKEVNSKQPKNVYSLPGGRIKETDSTPEDAAIRELYEETGMRTEELEYLGTHYAFITRDSQDVLAKVNLFYCERFCGDLTANFETVPEWIKLDTFFRGVKTALKVDYLYDIIVSFVKRKYNISETE